MGKPQAPKEVTSEAAETVELPIQSIRAKFQCSSVVQQSGTDYAERIHAHPVTADTPDGKRNENESFSKYTPSGVLELLVTNEAIEGFWESGHTYYIDITKVPQNPAV